ncbi:uncharacterized protein isoform X2 [Choristoneura fumiferana]|uniref:uncharacterized protein isoform X2 n=1 Tax=Choristoneura fumiferana TaxID=7141 RepID=UPI003D155029
MSVYNLWDKDAKEAKMKSSLSSDWTFDSPLATPRSASPPGKNAGGVGEAIFNKYIDIIHSKSNISMDAKQAEPLERPFDFYDDEEFAFGINLLNHNVACVGENITKLIQMAQEPWPENVKLFQPYEVEQILLPDNASCLAVQAFLKMCNLPFEVEMRWNAEFMSPSGRVPFIKCGAFVVSELEPIVQFAANKGVSLCGRLSTEEKAEMRAYMSLITNVLVNAELYISWIDNDTYNAVTKVRNSSVYPWPLGWLQTRSKRNMVAKRLKALHWHDKTLDQVLADVEQCCNSLSQRLGDKDYFFGTPTPLDALIYGHMRALLAASGPKASLMIKPITSSLLYHMLRIAKRTQMKLTPQEEYLCCAAAQAAGRRIPPRAGSERARRRPTPAPAVSRDSLQQLAFKPFSSKQMTITISKDGTLVCDDTRRSKTSVDDDSREFIHEILHDIMTKVDEIIIEIEIADREYDFVVYNNPHLERCNDLDTIDENESTLPNESEDVIKIIDSETDDDVVVVGDVMEKSDRNEPRPTELDALVFGHVFTVITTRLPGRRLADIVRRHAPLLALAQRVDATCFKRP